jgi:hypothetical protein
MHCAAIPFIGQCAESETWIDTGSEMPGFDNHVYLSATAVRQGMSLLGYPSPLEFEEMRKRALEAEDLALELDGKLTELERELAAFETLESAGRAQRRKPRTREMAA